MITASRHAFRITPCVTHPAGALDQLARDLDRQVAELTAQVRDVTHLRSRRHRAEQLETLFRSRDATHRTLEQRMADLERPAGLPPSELARVRLGAATLREADRVMKCGAKLMAAYHDQPLHEPPRMDEPWARRLGQELADLCARLGDSNEPLAHEEAALALAITPWALHEALGLGPARAVIARRAGAWLDHHGGRALDPQHLLALRLSAHPASGAAMAWSSLERLEGLCPALGDAAAGLFPELEALHHEALAGAHQLAGLRLTQSGRGYIRSLASQDHPLQETLLSPYAVLTLKRATPATADPRQARLGARGPRPALDVVVFMACGGPGGGPVRAVRTDLFHPPRMRVPGAALLLPGQSFRVMPARTQIHREREGGSTEVRHVELNKSDDRLPGRVGLG